jgi:hypothetical protein
MTGYVAPDASSGVARGAMKLFGKESAAQECTGSCKRRFATRGGRAVRPNTSKVVENR